MKKQNVIKKNHEFQDIIKGRNQKVSKSLVIYFRKNNEYAKIGISISKKFANAVYRNKYRRQVRNCLDLINMWEIKYDIILILRKPFLTLSFEDKRKELKKMLGRI